MHESAESTAQMSTKRDEILALTSLRGIAAMAVVMQHFSATAQRHSAVTIPSLVPHGYLAVDLFFILSGFIMSYTYLASFQRYGLRAYGDFLLKRIARIVPLNVTVLLVIVAMGQLSLAVLGRNIIYYSEHVGIDLVANLFMLQGLGIGRNLNAPSWSISTEFAAYIFFPFLIFLVFCKRQIFPFLVVLSSIVALVWLASLHQRLGLETGTIGEGVIRCFAEFALGMAAYRLYTWEQERSLHVLGSDMACFILTAACLAFMCLRIDLPAVLLFPFLIVAFAMNQGRPAKWMAHPFLHFLGLVSFSLYLMHQLFRPVELELLQYLHPAPLPGFMAMLFALLASFSVLPFAWLGYRYVERPGRALVRKLSLPIIRLLSPNPAS
jgi:peptidoglycan/LPS O-acetylase OafA/YrhL